MKMKTSFIACAIACRVFSCNAQVPYDTLFVNEIGTILPKEKADYYRIISPEGSNLYVVKDYYLNDTLFAVGHYTSPQAVIKEGSFIYYTNQGFKMAKGNYAKGFKTGEWLYYFEGGKKVKEAVRYDPAEKNYYTIQYDSLSGRKHAEGGFDEFEKRTGHWKEYHFFSDSVKTISNYESGIKKGEQLEFYKSGKLKRREIFEGFRVLHAEQYDEQGKKVTYFPAYEYPKPTVNIKSYLSAKVKCFDDVLKAQNVQLRLKVLADGSLSDIEVLNLIDESCKSRILHALYNMKRWKPYKREHTAYDFIIEKTIKYYTRSD